MIHHFVAPVKDAAEHADVTQNLEQARRNRDLVGVTISVARLTHPGSWSPKAEQREEKAEGTGKGATVS